MKHLLQETYKRTKKMTGIDARSPQGFKQAIADPNVFEIYKKSLAEGLSETDSETFMMLADNTRVSIMENSMFQLNPYETLTLPVLRVFYPKLIAKELVSVMPIDKPDVVKGFIHAYFKKYGETDYVHPFPSTTTDISRGPSVGVSQTGWVVQGRNIDILTNAGLDSSNSHVEKDFMITAVEDSTGGHTAQTISPTVDGVFSATVTIGNNTDVISGQIDYLNGTLTWASTTGLVNAIQYSAVCSLEENLINPTVKFEVEKIRLTVVDRRISAEWTVNLEQDVKALFDIALQSELVNIIGEQIAIDIDREIVNGLLATNAALNPLSHTDTFNLYPPTTYTWGRKMWYENIIPKLNTLSAQIYFDCLMGSANTIACNPLDAAVFESLDTFEYAGNSVDGGDVGYRSATVQGGKWKILVSTIVPQGKMILKYRSADMARAVFVYAPYVPALLTPYPLGPVPTLTILSRYATKVIRNQGIAVLNIVDVQN